ncbi:MAG TPA: hypothetical protein DDW76_13075 [Cyanobacteria bacterium UBA11369]|nr:hypothetical protein [Cyanobacteria bacterium UBA11367]HBE31595.1 hypothetical protein [Cyanobacteria bacterium UBA11368]HBE49690.1 hypothetical protein [Cyanobacteria bacterium UBA11369]
MGNGNITNYPLPITNYPVRAKHCGRITLTYSQILQPQCFAPPKQLLTSNLRYYFVPLYKKCSNSGISIESW